jgi:hypothetical protein
MFDQKVTGNRNDSILGKMENAIGSMKRRSKARPSVRSSNTVVESSAEESNRWLLLILQLLYSFPFFVGEFVDKLVL